MTYSRPGIRQTNANAGAPKPDRIRVGPVPQVQGSTTARFVDNSSPEIAGYNAGRGQAEMADFLKNLIEPVAQIGEQVDIAVANQQVGELMSEIPNLGELYREGDSDTRNRIRSMSPRAQDLMYDRMTQSAIIRFGEGYGQAAIANSILTDPSSSQADIAAAKSKLRSQFLESSGLSALPSGYVGANSAELAQVEGAVDGSLDKLRLQAESDRRDATAADGLGAKITTLSATFEQIDASDNSPEKKELSAQAITTLNTTLAEELKATQDAGDGTATQFLGNLIKGVNARIAEALLEEDTEKAQALLDTLTIASKGKIDVGDGQTNLWDLRLNAGNGKTNSVEQWLLATQKQIDAFENKAYRKRAQDAVAGVLPALFGGSPEEQAAARMQLPGLLASLDPEAALEALRVLNPALQFSERTTPEQQRVFTDTIYTDEFQGLSREGQMEKLKGLLNNGQISISQYSGWGNRGANTSEIQAYNDVNNARKIGESEGEYTGEINTLLQSHLKYAADSGNNSFTSQENWQETIKDQALARVSARTSDEIMARRARGESVDDDLAQKIFKNKLSEYVVEQQAMLKTAVDELPQAGVTTRRQVNDFLKNTSQGKSVIDAIPTSIKDEFSRQFPDREASDKNLIRYLAEKMINVKGPAGNPQYGANRAEARKWLIDQLDTIRKDTNSEAAELLSRPFSEQTGLDWNEQLRPSTQRRNQSSGEGDQASLPSLSEVASSALGAIAGVATPPAQAGTLTANEDQLATLERLWTKNEQPTLRTPGLPQIAATAPVEPVTMAIRTPNHPFFIAVGIAEGTRTANGGYTKNWFGHGDRGDGNWNRGTVSGGRNGGTPQQIDALWMGKMTRTQMSYAPLLSRFGIEKGTQGYNRLMFNIIDLSVQSPKALETLVTKIPEIIRGGISIEAIAKARADSFFIPGTTRLDTTFPNYSTLYSDQRSRAGVWDYRRRL